MCAYVSNYIKVKKAEKCNNRLQNILSVHACAKLPPNLMIFGKTLANLV